MKKCTECHQLKPRSEFYKIYKNQERVHPKCKECTAAIFKKNYDYERQKKYSETYQKKHPGRLKELNRLNAKKRRAENPEKFIEYFRKNKEKIYARRKQLPKSKKNYYCRETNVKAVLTWRKNHPEKWKCARKLRDHVKKGEIIKSNFCQICGQGKKLEGHHYDYSKPLNVIWCCRQCHATLDKVRRLSI